MQKDPFAHTASVPLQPDELAIPPKNDRKANDSKNQFVCKVCGRDFQHRSSFRAHEPTHTGIKPFQCNICHKHFALQWNLVSHLHTHTGVRRYKCLTCNAHFARSTTLREHMLVHVPLSERKVFRCDVCCKVFRSKKSLNGHQTTHAERRPFECDLCQRGFVSRRNLRNHQKCHRDQCLYSCDVCDIYFGSCISLALHRSEKHFTPEYGNFPEIISQLSFKLENSQKGISKKEYFCEQCSVTIETKVDWVQHMQKHFIDQHRCVCYSCGHSNRNLEDLKSHLEQHDDLLPPPPCRSPPKLTVSNYDYKYFVSFLATNGVDLPPQNGKLGENISIKEIPPPPPSTRINAEQN